ncbi:MAG: hypothetical protein HYV08_11745 [Deltaproteobacteria bacterium]|nr:hypothetical protein [Deltaproteobacteria bacterium]MBI3078685.1 hypothetical protein [Deltaproteobacteria bacterium]
MPPIFFVNCPKCDTRFYAEKAIWDEGEEGELLCPSCLHRFRRRDGKRIRAMF